MKILLAARLAVVSFFMGLVVFFQARYGALEESAPALFTIVAAYTLSIFYTLSLKYIKNATRFVYIQIFFDLLLATSMIYCTGGLNSPFAFLYILVILAASILLNSRDIYLTTSAASLLYGLSLLLEFYGAFQPLRPFPLGNYAVTIDNVALKIIINVALFFIIAYLGGSLAHILRAKEQQLEKQSEDFTLLKAFHENVLENMGSGFIAVNLNRIILSHNPATETILGLESSEIKNSEIDKTLQLPRLKRFFSHIASMEGSSRHFNWTYKRKDRTTAHIAMDASKFVVEGGIQGVIIALHDVSSLKSMERQVADAKRLAAIGRVAAGIAHEIRNPLASLSGSIQMLNSDTGATLNESDRRLMDISMREAERLNKIITQFLSYASPAKLNPAETDIGGILVETLTLIKSDARIKKNIRFAKEIDEGLIAFIDQEQIRQVIWNLCLNAIDSMNDGGVLTIKANRDTNIFDRRQSPRKRINEKKTFGNFIKIIFSDTGSGIEKENLEKIFEPFFTTKHVGTGLGLSTVHKIVESHGGKITAKSTVGKGTEFTIWFPVESIFETASSSQ